jgi:phage/plasmid-like protein (TIGR03299 family)
MSVQEILTQAKADWTVTKHPLLGPNGQPTPGFGIFRDDNQMCLGVVGSKYTPTQNSHMAETLMEAAGRNNVKVERAGMLGQGHKVYFQISLPDVKIGGSDSKRFLTALNSHDGSATIGFGSTNVVVICSNTFFTAMKDMTRIKHTANSNIRLQEIMDKMKTSLDQEERMIERMIEMSNTSISRDAITDDFLISIIGGDDETSRTKNRLSMVRAAMTPEFNTHGETAYAMFNAVTRYTNHMLNYKDVEAKRQSLMAGVAFKTNQKAFDIIESTFLMAPPTHHSFASLTEA